LLPSRGPSARPHTGHRIPHTVMHAIAVVPRQPKSARPTELREPSRQPDECLVRVLEVGIEGTDREIDAGDYGEAPHGEDVLVIGHESLGEVLEGANGVGDPGRESSSWPRCAAPAPNGASTAPPARSTSARPGTISSVASRDVTATSLSSTPRPRHAGLLARSGRGGPCRNPRTSRRQGPRLTATVARRGGE
jgi:hypothetical protein